MKKTYYYIPQMDCPTEEYLIRNCLEELEGIQMLSFNFIEKTLTVTHSLSDEQFIENILISLGMNPKPYSSFLESETTQSHSSFFKFIWSTHAKMLLAGVFAISAEIIAALSKDFYLIYPFQMIFRKKCLIFR